MLSAMVGSTTSIFWKRRASARSFSKMPRYSWKVVEPMQRNSPEASIGLIRFDASMVPPEAEPAPMMVWISSMNRIAPGCFLSWPITALRRFSKSPRYLVPATSAPRSSAQMVAFSSTSGTSPSTMRLARPSASAVLPTPASPT